MTMTFVKCVRSILFSVLIWSARIEGFGGKRALGILLKRTESELCRKRSKFRVQFCLGVLNNVL